MIFVDTSVWFAGYVGEESEHRAAAAILAAPSGRLVTTDYIVDELLTLLVARGQRPIAKAVGRRFWTGALCEIVWVNKSDFEAAWLVFDSFDDKTWSFTDCVSYVMKRLDIREAFALDAHFHQFGFVAVQP